MWATLVVLLWFVQIRNCRLSGDRLRSKGPLLWCSGLSDMGRGELATPVAILVPANGLGSSTGWPDCLGLETRKKLLALASSPSRWRIWESEPADGRSVSVCLSISTTLSNKYT